jgi:hypothetical protein
MTVERRRPHASKPTLVVHGANRPATVEALRKLLATTGELFDRDRVLVELVRDASGQLFTKPLTFNGVTMVAHRHCQPVQFDRKGNQVPITLPEQVARSYLDLGAWHVQPLAGITTGPLIRADGSILSASGYDPETQVFVDAPPNLSVPEHPTKQQAASALATLRRDFCTFPFSDGVMVRHDDGIDRVDLLHPPGQDESAFLHGLCTAAARASLWKAPGMLINGPLINGSGVGKGLLLGAVSIVAFGEAVAPFTAGHNREETDKRITTELLDGAPMLFLDNVNGRTFRSETLASALTERPARTRPMGASRSAKLNSAAFIAMGGNGLNVSEDMVRRLLQVGLDARMEEPDSRPFKPGFLTDIRGRRVELLSAIFTIMRWGRQTTLPSGRVLGSFELWGQWVRDPLFALGCADPVEGISRAKSRDPARQRLAELFGAWWDYHRDRPVRVAELEPEVWRILDPHHQGMHMRRQWCTDALQAMDGTRSAGFLLTRSRGGGKNSVATYRLEKVSQEYTTLDDTDDTDGVPPPLYKKRKIGTVHTDSDEADDTPPAAGPRSRATDAPHAYHRYHRGLVPDTKQKWRPDFRDPAYLRRREYTMRRKLAEHEAWKARQSRRRDDD